MATVHPTRTAPRRLARGLLREPWDAVPVGLSMAQGAALILAPSWPMIALGMLWNSNTVAHYAIHRPYFVRSGWNTAFSIYLSLLLGVPQALWRRRHLAHHAGAELGWRMGKQGWLETTLIVGLWTALAIVAPRFLLTVYAPGYALGLLLCQIHGHYEHAGGATSHYGRLYNWLFLNDGYHVEHHAWPTTHWSQLPARRAVAARRSRWPATLRWLDVLSLESLERGVLRRPRLRDWVLRAHERAFRQLLAMCPPPRRVTIVGGGLFPRTAIILRRLLPEAELTVVDGNAANIAVAQATLADPIRYIHAWYHGESQGSATNDIPDDDAVVIPLSFVGERAQLYAAPPARSLFVHDWIWRRRGRGAVISWWLLKRLNLVTSDAPA